MSIEIIRGGTVGQVQNSYDSHGPLRSISTLYANSSHNLWFFESHLLQYDLIINELDSLFSVSTFSMRVGDHC
jgi:hypothetical protein